MQNIAQSDKKYFPAAKLTGGHESKMAKKDVKTEQSCESLKSVRGV